MASLHERRQPPSDQLCASFDCWLDYRNALIGTVSILYLLDRLSASQLCPSCAKATTAGRGAARRGETEWVLTWSRFSGCFSRFKSRTRDRGGTKRLPNADVKLYKGHSSITTSRRSLFFPAFAVGPRDCSSGAIEVACPPASGRSLPHQPPVRARLFDLLLLSCPRAGFSPPHPLAICSILYQHHH